METKMELDLYLNYLIELFFTLEGEKYILIIKYFM